MSEFQLGDVVKTCYDERYGVVVEGGRVTRVECFYTEKIGSAAYWAPRDDLRRLTKAEVVKMYGEQWRQCIDIPKSQQLRFAEDVT